ncbi:F-box/LRR-repeat protein At1g67190-like [Curcuma longa]|uniref:F-box/LRR-repeat protein At1g67190-like n=1 Tax=Curcuma longa TaxID=136217 RepID=UPI003D9F50CC
MENLPVELIGIILTHLGTARDVVVASSTCKQWREAFKKHLHIATIQLEVIRTRIIFQTEGLQCLSIHVGSAHEFAAASIIAWIMHTKETLSSLSYNVRTTPDVNVLEKCSHQRFTCLKSLSLRHVGISGLDLSLFLAACPRIESLTLDAIEILTSDPQSLIELTSPTLKCIFVQSVVVDKIILMADNIESLHVSDLNLKSFELIGKSSLKHLKIKDVKVTHLDIGENMDHLMDVDVSNFMIVVPKFYQMLSKASKLRRLRLWEVVFADEDQVIDPESITGSFPELKHLVLSYEIVDGRNRIELQDFLTLENVDVLELGWIVISENFGHWVFEMIKRCPKLKKLVIHNALRKTKIRREQMDTIILAIYVALRRRCMHVIDLRFANE